jgi:hypothetical protein
VEPVTTKSIAIRVDPRLNDQIEAIAKREHNGIAAVCRRLLTEALAREERRAESPEAA